MKNALITFVERHPIMAFMIVYGAVTSARDTVVGVARAITGKYPPEAPKTQSSELPKVDISITKPEKDEIDSVLTDDIVEEVTGDILAD